MLLGLCSSASGNAALIASSTLDYVEENVQSFLAPRNGDESAWQARRTAAQACGRPIYAANCFLPADLPCVGPSVDRAAILAWSACAFLRAQQVGIKRIVFGSGASRRIPDGFDRATARGQFIDLLRALGPLAAAREVVLVVEPLNAGECNFINSVDEGAAIVREAAVPGVRLLADIYHMLRDGEGPGSIVRAGSLLAHAHVAEREKRTAPGVAGDDFTPFLQAFAAAGYAGALSIESGWTDLAGQLPAALTVLRRQLVAAESLAAKAR